MFLVYLAISITVAAALTLVFVGLFRNRGPWGLWWLFFLVVLFGSWTAGVWAEPAGPQIGGRSYLTFAFAGVFFALLLASAVPAQAATSVTDEHAQAAVSLFFWAMLGVLVLTLVVGYLL